VFSVDSVADASLEGPHRFFAAVALGLLAQVVGPSGGVVADLGDGDHVDGVVELTVAARVQSVSDDRAAGGLDGRGAVVAGGVPGRREAANVAGVAEEVGSDDGADPLELGDRRS
jgi:hypothetical protein